MCISCLGIDNRGCKGRLQFLVMDWTYLKVRCKVYKSRPPPKQEVFLLGNEEMNSIEYKVTFPEVPGELLEESLLVNEEQMNFLKSIDDIDIRIEKIEWVDLRHCQERSLIYWMLKSARWVMRSKNGETIKTSCIRSLNAPQGGASLEQTDTSTKMVSGRSWETCHQGMIADQKMLDLCAMANQIRILRGTGKQVSTTLRPCPTTNRALQLVGKNSLP